MFARRKRGRPPNPPEQGVSILLSSDSEGISSIASGGIDFGVSVGDPSHYGDAQASSDVPSQRGELASDPATLAMPWRSSWGVLEPGALMREWHMRRRSH